MNRKKILLGLFVVTLLVIDQMMKISVKTGMCLHESIRVTDWFYISFIENNGMAYGMSFIPKPLLTLFRFVACCFLVWYINKEVKRGARTLWLVLLAMVFAGAAGNLIDCMFYGLVFSGSSTIYPSFFVPFGTGYAPFLEGRVVDMLYFPLIVTRYPEWFPVLGGEPYIFFSPIFNFADACISVSVVAIILFCRREMSKLSKEMRSEELRVKDEE